MVYPSMAFLIIAAWSLAIKVRRGKLDRIFYAHSESHRSQATLAQVGFSITAKHLTFTALMCAALDNISRSANIKNFLLSAKRMAAYLVKVS